MPNTVISNASQHCQNYCSNVDPSSPQPRYLEQALWRSEGCISFSPSLCLPLVPIHAQKNGALQQQQRTKCSTGEPWGLLEASVGTARAETLGKWSSKPYKPACAAIFCLCQVSDRPKHMIPRHLRLTASPAAGLCICWRRSSLWWCSEGLSRDLEPRARMSKHATCSLRCYFATPKPHYYGNEADSSARLKNSREPWAAGGFFCWFFFF